MDTTAWGSCGRRMSKGFDVLTSRGSPRQTGESDFGDHRATRALCAPWRLPACAAVISPRPRSRNPASLHAGVLAFGVPPRTERPPQAGRGMGMPRPALTSSLSHPIAHSALARRPQSDILRGCSARATRPGLRNGNPPWQNRQVRHFGGVRACAGSPPGQCIGGAGAQGPRPRVAEHPRHPHPEGPAVRGGGRHPLVERRAG